LGEELEKHSLSDRGIELTDIEGSGGLGMRSSRAGGRASSIGILRVYVGNIGIDGRSSVCLASIQRSVAEFRGQLVDRSGGRHLEVR
jgi:hypothetical protein